MGLITVSWKVNELVSWRKWKISLRNVSNVIHCEWLLFRLIRSLSAYLRHDNFHKMTKGSPPSTKRDSGDSRCFEWTDQILWNCVGAFLNSYFVACCVLLYYSAIGVILKISYLTLLFSGFSRVYKRMRVGQISTKKTPTTKRFPFKDFFSFCHVRITNQHNSLKKDTASPCKLLVGFSSVSFRGLDVCAEWNCTKTTCYAD